MATKTDFIQFTRRCLVTMTMARCLAAVVSWCLSTISLLCCEHSDHPIVQSKNRRDPSVHVPTHIPTQQSVHPSIIHVHTHPSIRPSIYVQTHPLMYPSTHPPIYTSIQSQFVYQDSAVVHGLLYRTNIQALLGYRISHSFSNKNMNVRKLYIAINVFKGEDVNQKFVFVRV